MPREAHGRPLTVFFRPIGRGPVVQQVVLVQQVRSAKFALGSVHGVVEVDLLLDVDVVVLNRQIR